MRRLTLVFSMVLSSWAQAGARLPAVVLHDADGHTASYGREQLVAALIHVDSLRLLTTAPVAPVSALVLAWEDGRVLWFAGEGGIWRCGSVSQSRLEAFRANLRALEEAPLVSERLGPDADFFTLFARLSGERTALLSSWHPTVGPGMVATSRGIEALAGREPAAVLARDSAEYRAFRSSWATLETELRALAKDATGVRVVSPTFTWGPLEAPAFELQLRRENSAWRLELSGKGSAAQQFESAEALRLFLARQRPGTTLHWAPGCKRSDDQPILSSEQELEAFRRFCADHGIALQLDPSG